MHFGSGLNHAMELFGLAVNEMIDDFDMVDYFVESIVGFAVVFLGLWAVWLGIRALLRAARSLR